MDADDRLAAYASVRMLAGRTSHVAIVKLVIADAYRRVGLGTAMGEVIFEEAKQLSAHKVVVEMLEAQKSGQANKWQTTTNFSWHARNVSDASAFYRVINSL